ncbi:BON domain-containing protein [Tahibacter amnicola]|uniref:BON domain-containing protein n=1 Tax=Tahibacter amnicola TaxID=2976241 RepID=A0ABY6B8P3_9GAMM|nr:BON domain-containing protein [Tahibacter amnicola]UXI66039.1 BON domain-containing protein [Tahibacter amnicola]
MNLSRSIPTTSQLIAIALAFCGGLATEALHAQATTHCEALIGDQHVAAAIESRLRASSRIQADDIVVVVRAGMAELRGVVRSETQKRLAEQMARDIKGVDHLRNQLDVVDWPPVTDLARGEASRREGAHRSRQLRSDFWITTTVENTLALSHGADNCEIVVRTRDGIVVLQGIMASPEARRMAIDLVAGTYGVRSVDAAALLVAVITNAH